MLMIRRNAYLLTELQKLNSNTLIVLDSEDYLDPIMCKKAHKLGINMEFMIKHVGGDMISESSASHGFIEEEYIDDGQSLGGDAS